MDPTYLYIGDREACRVVNWPPRNTVRGWELDILCEPEMLEIFQRSRHYAFYVDDVELSGLETISACPITTRIDEQFEATLIFQHRSERDDSVMTDGACITFDK